MKFITRKALSLMFTVTVLLSTLFMGTTPAFAADNSGFAGGTGTQNDPYQVETAAQLENLQNYLGDSGKGVYFKLINNIDSDNFTAIGDENQDEFGGFFNGNGHSVNVVIIESDPCLYASSGLFRAVSKTGEIDNLEVKGAATGNCDIGGLAGINRGIIKNCSSSVAVTGGSYSCTGGLVGKNLGEILDSCATGKVSCSTGSIGGFAGLNLGTIDNCSATGEVSGGSYIGGFVGYNGGMVPTTANEISISNSYASGKVSGGAGMIGGLVGFNGRGNATYKPGKISASYAIGSVSGGNGACVGGLVGFNGDASTSGLGGSIDNSYATGTAEAGSNAFVGGFVGFNGNVHGNTDIGEAIVSASYATGAVTAVSGDIGGFAGANTSTVQNSYYNIDSAQTVNEAAQNPKKDIAESTTTTTVTGLPTEKMTGSSAEANMPAFNFSFIWASQQNTDLSWYYPQLQTLVNGSISAKAASLASVTVTVPVSIVSAFDPLDRTIKMQNVENGTSLSLLKLPDSLNATINGATVAIHNITWSASPAYLPTAAGTYIFTPVLPVNYSLSSGVNLPTVTVTVNAASSFSYNLSTPSLPSTVTDTPSNIVLGLSGAFFPSGVTNVTLSATQPTQGDRQEAEFQNLLFANAKTGIINIPKLCNISLDDQNGNPAVFAGTVTVKIPVPAGVRGTPHIFRYEPDTKTFTDMNAKVENGFLVFSTDHLGSYAIAGVGDAITLDTLNYQMPVGGHYQIGIRLSGTKAAVVKYHSTSDSTATVAKLQNGNYQVIGKGIGTAWIMFDVYDGKNKFLTHASVRIDAKTGIRPRGDSTRQIGIF